MSFRNPFDIESYAAMNINLSPGLPSTFALGHPAPDSQSSLNGVSGSQCLWRKYFGDMLVTMWHTMLLPSLHCLPPFIRPDQGDHSHIPSLESTLQGIQLISIRYDSAAAREQKLSLVMTAERPHLHHKRKILPYKDTQQILDHLISTMWLNCSVG